MPVVGGRYELGQILGAGGFATVYLAKDLREDREVAVKVIPFGEDAEKHFEKFRNEALSLSRLRSRFVARVHEFGRDDAVGLYLVMDYVDGVPLSVKAIGRSLLPHEVLRLARGLLEGLAEAHAAGLVHRDIKPANVLVPRSKGMLDEPRLLDFGIARSDRRAQMDEALGNAELDEGYVFGTPAYMAPEQLSDGKVGAAADVYSAGLLLFELLDVGPLFEGSPRDQLHDRLEKDPVIAGRVPPPLSDLLEKMLARDSTQRFGNAAEAFAAIGDLETAPVSLGAVLGPPSTSARDLVLTSGGGTETRCEPACPASPAQSVAQDSRAAGRLPSLQNDDPCLPVSPDDSSGGVPARPPPLQSRIAGSSASSAPPPSIRMPARAHYGHGVNASIAPDARNSSRPPQPRAARPISTAAYGAKRMSRLGPDGITALRDALHALDVAMVDALARRERGSLVGRVARSVALALRLELDAAALILEPLAVKSDLARAFGCCLLAPRARRVTRGRIDTDREDAWTATLDLELGSMLGCLGVAMTTRDDAARNETRCARLLERGRVDAAQGAVASEIVAQTTTTLRMARLTAACLTGASPKSAAIAEIIRLRDADTSAPTNFNVLMRALLQGALGFRADEHLAREQLERAARLSAETGNTLLETRASVAWGGMLVEIPDRVEQGLRVLERATTLLAHGDAPSLEHIAEHNRGAALIIQGRYSEAAPHFGRAREAARGERSLEHEMLSSMNEAFSLVCLGDQQNAARVVAELADSRLVAVSARTASYAHVARSLYALAFQDIALARVELRSAQARAAEAEADGGDVYLITEALALIYAAANGEPVDFLRRAGELEKVAQDCGFVSFYWFDILATTVSRIKDDALRLPAADAMRRLVVLLAPQSQVVLTR